MNTVMSYKPNKQQIKALLNGATALVEPIVEFTNKYLAKIKIWSVSDDLFFCFQESFEPFNMCFHSKKDDCSYWANPPLQVGDTFTVEKWIEEHEGIEYTGLNPIEHNFKIVSVEVKRIKELLIFELNDLKALEALSLEETYDSQYGQGAYEADPYVFYIKVKEM